MKKLVITILTLISVKFCFSQNPVVSGFEPTTGRPGYKIILSNLHVTSPLIAISDSVIGMDTSRLSFTVSKNAGGDSSIFLFFDGTRVAIFDRGGTVTATDGVRVSGGNVVLGDAATRTAGVAQVVYDEANQNFSIGQSGNLALGYGSISFGSGTNASGDRSFAGGYSSKAGALLSFAVGNDIQATGETSFAVGEGSNGTYGLASGKWSFVNGYYNNAIANASTTIGYFNNTSCVAGFTSGYWNNNASAGHQNAQVSTDTGAVTIGMYNTTSGKGTFVAGIDNRAYGYGNTTVGVYADSAAAASTTAWSARNKAFVVGNGTAQTARSNAFTVYQGGGIVIQKMTKTQRDALSGMVQGEMVFVTDNGGYLSWYNSGWFKVNSTAD